MRPRRVLIIDDEERFTSMMKHFLEHAGPYEVRGETHADRAVVSAREFQPDLVLLDVYLPDMEAEDVVEALQREPSLKQIPIIFLTALVTEEEVETNHGFIAGRPFVAKSLNVRTMIDAIEQRLAALPPEPKRATAGSGVTWRELLAEWRHGLLKN